MTSDLDRLLSLLYLQEPECISGGVPIDVISKIVDAPPEDVRAVFVKFNENMDKAGSRLLKAYFSGTLEDKDQLDFKILLCIAFTGKAVLPGLSSVEDYLDVITGMGKARVKAAVNEAANKDLIEYNTVDGFTEFKLDDIDDLALVRTEASSDVDRLISLLSLQEAYFQNSDIIPFDLVARVTGISEAGVRESIIRNLNVEHGSRLIEGYHKGKLPPEDMDDLKVLLCLVFSKGYGLPGFTQPDDLLTVVADMSRERVGEAIMAAKAKGLIRVPSKGNA
jgi:hypothetical protein